MKFEIPYGKSLIAFEADGELLVPDSSAGSARDPDDAVIKAMESPIGSRRLCDIAAGRKNAVIIISDHTRPVPSRHILPHMLSELRENNPGIAVTLLVATGCHRKTFTSELRDKLGDDIYSNEKIVVHDAHDPSRNTDIGVLPSGARLVIDKTAAEADLLISEGFIEPHFFAGFSGGRKSVLPGICDKRTVLGNHCGKFIASEYASSGILENNPIHRDMIAAAEMAKLEFIVNVVINADKKITAAFAGDPFRAHETGCRLILQTNTVRPKKTGDIVITSNGGYPLDQNIYQSVKGLAAADRAAAPDGIIIIAAECSDGSGGDSFSGALINCSSPAELARACELVPMDETLPDQWEYQILSHIMARHRVIFVASPDVKNIIEAMKLDYSGNLERALNTAREVKGPGAHIVVIPDGVSVIVTKSSVLKS